MISVRYKEDPYNLQVRDKRKRIKGCSQVLGLENGRMLADVMGKGLFRGKASSGARKLTLPLSLRGGGRAQEKDTEGQ